MSRIAVLGAGRVGGALAGGLADAGHTVIVATRDGARPSDWKNGATAFATLGAAIAESEFAFGALPGDVVPALLAPHVHALSGKVLVDVANATARGPDGRPGGLVYPGWSLAEELQRTLPGTKVVKTLNTMLFPVMVNPGLVAHANVFLSGNDDGAKAQVRGLLLDLGWRAEVIEDLGDIGSARAPEAFILLVPAMLKTYGMKPFAMAIAR